MFSHIDHHPMVATTFIVIVYFFLFRGANRLDNAETRMGNGLDETEGLNRLVLGVLAGGERTQKLLFQEYW